MLRKFEFLETIGQGSFGKVRRALLSAAPAALRQGSPHPPRLRARVPALAGEEGALPQHGRGAGGQDY